jgi:GDPmannose 4,6-dehydratase
MARKGLITGITGQDGSYLAEDFVQAAFQLVGHWTKHVEVDKPYMRPTNVAELRGDASRAAQKLGWKPETTLEELVHEMLENDLWLEGLDPARCLDKPPASVRR